VAVLGDGAASRLVLASDAGYGFIARLEDLYAKPKGGKAVLSLPEGAQVLPPVPVIDVEGGRLAAVTTSGHLLVFSLTELPEMSRGKGNKIIGIPSARIASREELVVALAVVPPGAGLTISSGRRTFTLRPADLDLYAGERGRRGKLLPRGFQRVDGLQAASN
jgi:topoisomerase-4 subunit A